MCGYLNVERMQVYRLGPYATPQLEFKKAAVRRFMARIRAGVGLFSRLCMVGDDHPTLHIPEIESSLLGDYIIIIVIEECVVDTYLVLSSSCPVFLLLSWFRGHSLRRHEPFYQKINVTTVSPCSPPRFQDLPTFAQACVCQKKKTLLVMHISSFPPTIVIACYAITAHATTIPMQSDPATSSPRSAAPMMLNLTTA